MRTKSWSFSTGELAKSDCVMLGDIGVANTLLLHPDTFVRSKTLPNRLEKIRDYVLGGGGLVTIGGYMTFQGIDAKARYRNTEVAEVLGAEMEAGDDRPERPQGVKPRVAAANHPIVGGLEAEWPALLGYNRFAARQRATVVATVGNDPLIVAAEFGKGRSVVFASDCGPHWAPPGFVDWPGYTTIWRQIVGWAAGA